jgi:hypothetical protein
LVLIASQFLLQLRYCLVFVYFNLSRALFVDSRASAFGYYLTTQLTSTTASQCSVRWGLPPHCWCALSGARRDALPRVRRCMSRRFFFAASAIALLRFWSCGPSISIDLPAIAPSLDVRRRIAQERVPTILRQRLLKTSEPEASSMKRSLHDHEGAPIEDHSVKLTFILDSSGIFAPRRVITKHY